MLPHWRRRFEAFSNSQTGQLVLWGLFLYSILSGFLFRAMNLFFTLWLFAPLLLFPVLAATRKRAQTAQRPAAGFGQQASAGRGASWFQQQAQYAQRQQQQAAERRRNEQQAKRSPFGSEDGPVIDAEWRDAER